MTGEAYDAVIVGGRCAGAALATFLARDGASVALLDADAAGSDQLISTHTVHPSGMDVLDELGVAEAVRALAPPPATAIRFEVDGAYVDVELPPGRFECCPRRYRLDRLVQEAAVDAGAEFLDRTRVTEVLVDEGRVTGVRATRDGSTFELKASITVGADGRRSTVAKAVGAEEYLAYDSPRGMFWAYWQPPRVWQSDDFPFDFLLKFDGTHRRVVFSTDDGQLLIGTLPPMRDALAWRPDLEASFLDDLRSDVELEPLVSGGAMTSKVIGTVSERYFFRRSAGPGWALVGDAGHHKDPIIGWGISEALEQAKNLAAAIGAGGDAALERYWRQRDVDSIARFRLAEDRGRLGPINAVFPMVLRKLPGDPALAQRLAREIEYGVNPYELLPVPKVAVWTLAAALRKPSLLVSFAAQGKRAAAVKAEIGQRRKLLDAIGAGA
jgi:flavin-dependent dehydrogenase